MVNSKWGLVVVLILLTACSKGKAMEIFEKIVVDYSDSIFTTEARKRFRKLRGDENIEL